MEEIRNKIMSVIGKPFLASLATLTGDGKPWVRYVYAVGSDDMTIRFSTFLNARKAGQIAENPEVHMTGGVIDPMNWTNYLPVSYTHLTLPTTRQRCRSRGSPDH